MFGSGYNASGLNRINGNVTNRIPDKSESANEYQVLPPITACSKPDSPLLASDIYFARITGSIKRS